MSSTTPLSAFVRSQGQLAHQASGIDYLVGQHPKVVVVQQADNWTFPTLSKHPQLANFSDTLLWMAMLKGKQVLGVAILSRALPEEAMLISFKVHPQFRQRTIGTTLLHFCEAACRQREVTVIQLTYRTYWKSNNYWEKILQKRRWEYRASSMYYVFVNDTNHLAKQMERHAIPSINTHPFTPEKWIQLQQTLKSSEWQQTVPEGLNPFQLADKRLDKQASFLIYDENNQHLIGWYIGHQLSEVAWQVTSIFIRKAYRKKNIGLAAIREMAIRHQNRGRVHFMVQPENTKMLAYINRYLTRWGCELFQQVVASKKL